MNWDTFCLYLFIISMFCTVLCYYFGAITEIPFICFMQMHIFNWTFCRSAFRINAYNNLQLQLNATAAHDFIE
uniref:Secreted protein n=1 Tax=Panagrellus redivivus TaxID=6233 RepID=A0A7E4ZS27_PANRE